MNLSKYNRYSYAPQISTSPTSVSSSHHKSTLPSSLISLALPQINHSKSSSAVTDTYYLIWRHDLPPHPPRLHSLIINPSYSQIRLIVIFVLQTITVSYQLPLPSSPRPRTSAVTDTIFRYICMNFHPRISGFIISSQVHAALNFWLAIDIVVETITENPPVR